MSNRTKSHDEFLLQPDGTRIFTRSWQPAGPARGIVAICHGVKSHSGYFNWLGKRLAETGLAVYALDLRGRGRSSGERFFVDDAARYVDDVGALVDLARSREGNLPVFLLGHSAGGVVSHSTRWNIKMASQASSARVLHFRCMHQPSYRPPSRLCATGRRACPCFASRTGTSRVTPQPSRRWTPMN